MWCVPTHSQTVSILLWPPYSLFCTFFNSLYVFLFYAIANKPKAADTILAQHISMWVNASSVCYSISSSLIYRWYVIVATSSILSHSCLACVLSTSLFITPADSYLSLSSVHRMWVHFPILEFPSLFSHSCLNTVCKSWRILRLSPNAVSFFYQPLEVCESLSSNICQPLMVHFFCSIIAVCMSSFHHCNYSENCNLYQGPQCPSYLRSNFRWKFQLIVDRCVYFLNPQISSLTCWPALHVAAIYQMIFHCRSSRQKLCSHSCNCLPPLPALFYWQ